MVGFRSRKPAAETKEGPGAQSGASQTLSRSPLAEDEHYAAGVHGEMQAWLARNVAKDIAEASARGVIAPFPPPELMLDVSGLTDAADFASHGASFMRALAGISPKALESFDSVLDYGVGCGRLARMFKGFKGRYVGADVDARQLDWTSANLPHVECVLVEPREPLPFRDDTFEAVIAVSVFTHLSEPDQLFYLAELGRVVKPGGVLMLTTHGERAVARAIADTRVRTMLTLSCGELKRLRLVFEKGSGFHFVRQLGHLTTEQYDYGMSFISSAYVRRCWPAILGEVEIHPGALHDFQDVVLIRKPNAKGC